MFGNSPLAIPYTFRNTKFPNLEDKMKTLQKNREEVLAAHELVRWNEEKLHSYLLNREIRYGWTHET